MKDVFVRYLIDLYQDIPTSIYEGLLSIFCFGMVALVTLKGLRKGLIAVIVLLVVEYIFLIYCCTVIFRPLAETAGHNFMPLWSYDKIFHGDTTGLLAENIMNVVVFVPVGLLLSCVSRRLKRWMVLFIGLGISLSIETLQYFYHKGFSEVDDIIHNTLGCAIGIMIVAVIKGIWLLQKRYSMN